MIVPKAMPQHKAEAFSNKVKFTSSDAKLTMRLACVDKKSLVG